MAPDLTLWSTESSLRVVAVASGTLKAGLQIVSTLLQFAGVVEGAVGGRPEGALFRALGELDLAVNGYIAAAV